jgi:hypothetical protein
MALQSRGDQKLKKNLLTLQSPVLKHPESSFYVVLLVLEFEFDCRTSGGAPIVL